jgi:glycerol-3-phosphate dehydrogenase
LAGRSDDDGRSISRDIAVLDHGKKDGLGGFFSVTGGKATTLRIMGELAADAVAQYLGSDETSQTALFELYPYAHFWRVQ